MLKKVAIAVAIVALIGAGVAYYMFRQATALPEWYEAELALESEPVDEDAPMGWEPIEGAELEPVPEESQPTETPRSGGAPDKGAAPKSAPRKRSATKRGPRVMRGFHRRRATKGKKTAVKASRATYDNGKLEAGVVLDLSRVPKENLTPRDKRLYERAVEGFPGLTKRDVYVGIEDRPVSKDGVLQLGDSPKVRVGNLRYSLSSAAAKLGMSEATLRRDFDNELRRLGFTDPQAVKR